MRDAKGRYAKSGKKCNKCNKCSHNKKGKENHRAGAVPVSKPHGKKY